MNTEIAAKNRDKIMPLGNAVIIYKAVSSSKNKAIYIDNDGEFVLRLPFTYMPDGSIERVIDSREGFLENEEAHVKDLHARNRLGLLEFSMRPEKQGYKIGQAKLRFENGNTPQKESLDNLIFGIALYNQRVQEEERKSS